MNWIKPMWMVVVVLLLLATGGCYKDKGNYQYTAIDTVRIAYDTSGKAYNVLQFDTLRIKPVITLTAGSKEADLRFEWSVRAVDPTSATQQFPVTVLSVKRNLDTVMTIVPGKYALSLKATDGLTGISSYLFYDLTISSSFSEGWLLMEQVKDSGDVAVITPGGKLLDRIYSSVNGMSLPGDVQRIDVANLATPQEVYLLSANDAVEVNPVSFGRIRRFNNWFFYPPAVKKPTANALLGFSFFRAGVLLNNGLAHIKRFGGFPGAVLYGSELLLDGKTDYSFAPYVLPGNFSSSLFIAAMYDTKGKRFIGLRGSAGGIDGNLVHFTAPDTTAAFNPDNVGMNLLYMGPTRQQLVYNAILNDDGGNAYLHQLNLSIAQSARLKQRMNAPGIAGLAAATSSLQLDYVYYATGNQIYLYEIGPNTATPIFTFPAGENITTLLIDANKSATDLLATTWNGSTGTAYTFSIDITGKFKNDAYTARYQGLGKVVSTKYKPK